MVYIEAQDKKLKFGIKLMSYKLVGSINRKTDSIDPKSHINKISKCKKAITYSFEAQIVNRFFQYLKDIIS